MANTLETPHPGIYWEPDPRVFKGSFIEGDYNRGFTDSNEGRITAEFALGGEDATVPDLKYFAYKLGVEGGSYTNWLFLGQQFVHDDSKTRELLLKHVERALARGASRQESITERVLSNIWCGAKAVIAHPIRNTLPLATASGAAVLAATIGANSAKDSAITPIVVIASVAGALLGLYSIGKDTKRACK